MTITFNPPAVPLDCVTELALGADLTADPATWVWTDVTGKVRHAAGVSYQTGRADQWATTDETFAELVFDNRSGEFSRHNPSSPYYGQLSKNTPLRSGFDAGEGVVYPVQQYVTEWPNRWDISRTDKTTKIRTAGVRRRLTQGAVAKSALRRTWDAETKNAYWPIEEGSDARSLASATGGQPLNIRGDVALGGTLATLGSAGSADLSATGAGLSGSTGIPSTSVTSWEVEATIGWDELPTIDYTKMYPIMTIKTPGSTIEQWYVFLRGISPYQLYGFSLWCLAGGTIQEVITVGPIRAGEPQSLRLAFAQNGVNIDINVDADGPSGTTTAPVAATLYAPTYFEASSTFYSDSIGGIPPTFAAGWQVITSAPTSFSHLAFITPKRVVPSTYQASNGYKGETAGDRMERVCEEEGIRFTLAAGETVEMGPQPVATPLDVLDDCAKVDLGVLYQADFGLAYQPTDARTNATSQMSISFAQLGEAPESADDDALYRNQWTVSRPGGISATVTNDEGVAYNGLYDDETQANVEDDTMVIHQAGWRTNRDSIDVPRWPDVFINFANAAATPLISDFTALDFGPMVTLTSPPSPHPPENRLVFIEGVSGFFTPLDFTARLTNSPADAYRVGEYASDAGDTDALVGRYLSDGSTLRANITSGATSFDVDSGGGMWWATDADDFDPDLRLRLFPAGTELHGEEIDVSAVTDVAGTFVSVGLVVGGTGAGPATPGMPASIAVGDTLFAIAVNRNIVPTVTPPAISSADWTLVADDSIGNQPANLRVWARTYDGVFTAPSFTFGGGGTVDYQAQICAFRGLPLDATKVVLSHAACAVASAANIEAPPMRPRHRRRLLIAIGWRADDWTSVATYVATGTTFTEISEPDVTAGDDQGFVWDYAFQTAEVDVPAGSFVVTGGGAAATRGVMLLCDGGHQTLTVSARGAGGTTARAWSQYDRVETAQPAIAVLAT